LQKTLLLNAFRSGAACIFLAATFPAKADCTSSLVDAQEIASNIAIAYNIPKPLSAGASMQITWTYKSSAKHRRPQIPIYIVVAAPADVRFAGNGFIALTANAEGPYKIIYGRKESRAFVPQHRSVDRATSGEINVTPYRAGLQNYSWAIVTAGTCGEKILSHVDWTAEVVAGAAQLVIQDKFSIEKPKQRILSPAKTYELLVFPQRYEVHEVATGAKLIDRPGVDPNFSPTGRFVAARTTYTLEIFDLVSGKLVRKVPADHFLAWARGDSFAIAGGRDFGRVSFINSIIDQNEIPEANVSCHACDAWSDVRVILDIDRGFFAAVGIDQYDIRDLVTLTGATDTSLSDTSGNGLRFLRQTYDAQYPVLPKTWSLGEKLALTHAFPDGDTISEKQSSFVVKHLDITSASPSEQLVRTADLRGRGLARMEMSPTLTPKISNIYTRLSGAGISTLVPPPISRNDFPVTTYDDKGDVQRKTALAELFRRIPKAESIFRQHTTECGFEEAGADEIAIDPDWIDQIYEWKEGADNTWLIQATCYAGSGGFVNWFDVVVIRDLPDGMKARSILKALGNFERGGTSQTTSNFKVFRDEGRRIIVVSTSDQLAAVINIDTFERQGSVIAVAEPELFSEARKTSDGQHLLQINSDGRFFIYRISDGKRVLDGAYVDDEIVVMTTDGQYDTTFEGAYAVQVRFAGIPGLFSFSQFDSSLRRPGLAQAILGGGDVILERMIKAPPTVEFTVKAVPNAGQRTGRIIAVSDRELSAIRLYVDGRLEREIAVTDRRADIPVEFRDPGGGRWISAIALDKEGLSSLPSAIKLPGAVNPRGTARVVSIGVDKYSDPKISTLNSAKFDAKNFVEAMATREGRAFTSVRSISLLDADVTQDRVLAAIKYTVSETETDDTMIVYFAGHGIDGAKLNQPAAGLILTTNRTQLDDLASTSVRWSALAEVLSQSKGTVIVILDACQSGIAGSEAFTTNDAVVSALTTKANAPLVVLAASKGRQLSHETMNKGGEFTNAIVAAILAKRNNNGADETALIDLGELYSSVKSRVFVETNGEQTPWLTRNGLVGEMSLF
jgi:hypothetical protein